MFKNSIKIKIIMMLKDEDALALTWIKYHSSIVGYENLHIFDNGSTSPGTIAALKFAEQKGSHVDRSLNTVAHFVERGSTFVDFMKKTNAKEQVDFWFLLDVDEFLAVSTPILGKLSMSREDIMSELRRHVRSLHPLHIRGAFDNNPTAPGFFNWSDQKKLFFASAECIALDHGYHNAVTRQANEPRRTRIVYIHFHYKPYALLIEHAKRKLAPFTDEFSVDALRSYVEEERDAHHCAVELLWSEADYTAILRASPKKRIKAISDAFAAIGCREPFS